MTADTAGRTRLSFVLCEIRNAQNEGLIPMPKKQNSVGRLAKFIINNVGMKLTKQEKDRALIKFIKNERRFILETLMRDSVVGNIDQMEEKIEVVFEDMTARQQTQLQEFFTEVEAKVEFIQKQIDVVQEKVDSYYSNKESENR